MTIVEGSIRIDAPPEGLFALSQNYVLRRDWDPFVREMRLLQGAQEAAKGVRVWVRAWTGLTMEVQFVGFQPPTSVAIKMLRGPSVFHQFAGTWLFKRGEGGQTEVIFRYSFTTRWPWLRPLIDPVIRWAFQRDVCRRLHGLKRGAEELDLLHRLANKVPKPTKWLP